MDRALTDVRGLLCRSRRRRCPTLQSKAEPPRPGVEAANGI